MSVRVRFAPSPTGHLHVGGARTALYNWLFARRQKGEFLLRIEDTDVERSSDEMVEGILDGLEWLGLDWDNDPVYQSRRLGQHREAAERLLKTGWAYRDFSDPETQTFSQYRDLSEEDSRDSLDQGRPFCIRFRVPDEGRVGFQDLVFGSIEVDLAEVQDFVILRSDGSPTYHLSVVCDDIDMEISHVVRGADHLSNTPKHVLLFRGLEREAPLFAHLPLILGPDRKRLSKRHGATSVMGFREKGLLPEAVVNYLALLGWSPGDDSELLNRQALIEKFDLARVNKADAVFDVEKLEWINKQHLSSRASEELADPVESVLRREGLWEESWGGERREWFLGAIELLKTRVRDVDDFAAYGRPYFSDEFEYEEAAIEKHLEGEEETRRKLMEALEELRRAYEKVKPFDLKTTESRLRALAEKHELKTGRFIGAVRVATTGSSQAPGIFDVLVTLGREKTVERLERLLDFMENE